MVGVSAIDHIISRRCVRCPVDRFDGLAEQIAAGQATIGFDGEGYDRGQSLCLCGTGNADRFRDAGHGDGRDHVDAARCEGLDLRRVNALRGFRIGDRAGFIAVTCRADDPVDENVGNAVRPIAANITGKIDGVAAQPQQVRFRPAKLVCPYRRAAPGRGVEHKSRVRPIGHLQESVKIAAQRRSGVVIVQQHNRGKFGGRETLLEEQPGLQSAIGEPGPVGLHQSVNCRHRISPHIW